MSTEILSGTPYNPDENRQESAQNGSGWSSHAAAAKHGDVEPFFYPKIEEAKPAAPPRKAHRSGHVQDFYNRPPEEDMSSGFIRPQSPEDQAALDRAMPELKLEHDVRVLSRIQDDYVAHKISYTSARGRVYTHYKDELPIETIYEIFEEYFGDGYYRSNLKKIETEYYFGRYNVAAIMRRLQINTPIVD